MTFAYGWCRYNRCFDFTLKKYLITAVPITVRRIYLSSDFQSNSHLNNPMFSRVHHRIIILNYYKDHTSLLRIHVQRINYVVFQTANILRILFLCSFVIYTYNIYVYGSKAFLSSWQCSFQELFVKNNV